MVETVEPFQYWTSKAVNPDVRNVSVGVGTEVLLRTRETSR
jgi:hypothetical protein